MNHRGTLAVLGEWAAGRSDRGKHGAAGYVYRREEPVAAPPLPAAPTRTHRPASAAKRAGERPASALAAQDETPNDRGPSPRKGGPRARDSWRRAGGTARRKRASRSWCLLDDGRWES